MRADTYLRKLRESSKTDLVAACLELARHVYDNEPRSKITIAQPSTAFKALQDLGRERTERLVVLCLDGQSQLARRETVSVGAINTVRTLPREIFRPAIVHGAAGIILAHNHPSGCVDPSPEDVEFTGKIAAAGEIIGIELFDHLIVTRDAFTSLRERGVL